MRLQVKQNLREIPEKFKRFLNMHPEDYVIVPMGGNTWKVRHIHKDAAYTVKFDTKQGRFTCSCPDWRFRRNDYPWCKHIFMVALQENLPKEVVIEFIKHPEVSRVIQPVQNS